MSESSPQRTANLFVAAVAVIYGCLLVVEANVIPLSESSRSWANLAIAVVGFVAWVLFYLATRLPRLLIPCTLALLAAICFALAI